VARFHTMMDLRVALHLDGRLITVAGPYLEAAT